MPPKPLDPREEAARLAAFEALTEGGFFKFTDPEGQAEYVWPYVDTVLDAYLAAALPESAPNVLTPGTKEVMAVSNEDLRGRELAALYDGLRQAIDGMIDGEAKDYAEEALARAEGYRSRLAPTKQRVGEPWPVVEMHRTITGRVIPLLDRRIAEAPNLHTYHPESAPNVLTPEQARLIAGFLPFTDLDANELRDRLSTWAEEEGH